MPGRCPGFFFYVRSSDSYLDPATGKTIDVPEGKLLKRVAPEADAFYKALGETQLTGEMHNAVGDIYMDYMDIPESVVPNKQFAPLETAYRNYEANPTVANASAFLDEAGRVQRLAGNSGYSVESPYVRMNAAIEADAEAGHRIGNKLEEIDRGKNIEDNITQEDVDGLQDSKSETHDGTLNEKIMTVFLPDGRKVMDFSDLPGHIGVEVPRRLTVDEMTYLTNEYGVEFAQIYRRGAGSNGGGGKYIIYSGDVSSVKIPIESDVILVNHTHPGGTKYPSRADKKVLALLEQVGSPQRTSEIVPVGNDSTFRFTKKGAK